MNPMNQIPLSLYIHIPWCIKKCPYCDFNSHVTRQEIPEKDYLNALISDFNQQLSYRQEREIQTVFIGGGTPSLMSPAFYQKLLKKIMPYLAQDAEITLEANPGTLDFGSTTTERSKFHEYRDLGINRLSLGIQSLQDQKLQYIGRMHSAENALRAIELARISGFEQFNCDLMFGLPEQTMEEALGDLKHIIAECPAHISWYQLTIEPNTHFYRRPPQLPADDALFDMQQQGQALLAQYGYEHYEVSAYAQAQQKCQHNLNYWLFGDYIGIGAGAHGKITLENQSIIRSVHAKNPGIYMKTATDVQIKHILKEQHLFEFMLNTLRLKQPIPYHLVETRSFIPQNTLLKALAPAVAQQLIRCHADYFELTERGSHFINEILLDFLNP